MAGASAPSPATSQPPTVHQSPPAEQRAASGPVATSSRSTSAVPGSSGAVPSFEPPPLTLAPEELEKDRALAAVAAEARGDRPRGHPSARDGEDEGEEGEEDDVNGFAATSAGKKWKKKVSLLESCLRQGPPARNKAFQRKTMLHKTLPYMLRKPEALNVSILRPQKNKRKRGSPPPAAAAALNMDADYDPRTPNDYTAYKELLKARREAIRQRQNAERRAAQDDDEGYTKSGWARRPSWDHDDSAESSEEEDEERRRKLSQSFCCSWSTFSLC